jgi:hypothetical protein
MYVWKTIIHLLEEGSLFFENHKLFSDPKIPRNFRKFQEILENSQIITKIFLKTSKTISASTKITKTLSLD